MVDVCGLDCGYGRSVLLADDFDAHGAGRAHDGAAERLERLAGVVVFHLCNLVDLLERDLSRHLVTRLGGSLLDLCSLFTTQSG